MKALKIKFGLFSLLMVLAASIFLTSCEQENILPTTVDEVTEQHVNANLLLPQDIVGQGEEAVEAYMKSLSKEQIVQHANDYIIMNFLKEAGKLEQIDEELQVVGSFRDIDLSNYLSAEDVNELNTQKLTVEDNQISERYWICYDVYTYFCCGNIYQYCCRVCVWIV